MSRGRRWSVVLAGASALICGAIWAWDAWKARAALAEVRRAIDRGRYREALPRLIPLAARGRGWEVATLLLGDCHEALGDPDAALAAWARVPEGGAEAGQALLQFGRLAIERGRFAPAEHALLAARALAGPEAPEARTRLLRLYWREARFEDAARLIEEQWRALDSAGRLGPAEAVDLLRAHLALDLETFPIEEIDAELRRAGALAPEDDRVLLGRARWAVLAGRFDDAAAWLDVCERRRPDDPVVWRARLEWACASSRLDGVRTALTHLPAERFTVRQALALRAWLASRRGDTEAERAVLDRLVGLDPSDGAALERLAELYAQAGQPARATRLRQRRVQLDEARHDYQALFRNDALASRPREMARLAERLGRSFEGRAFLALAAGLNSSSATRPGAGAQFGRSEPSPPASGPGRTMAELLAADLGPDTGRTPPIPAPAPEMRFTDDSETAGLAFVYDQGASPGRQLPETMNGGVGLLDYDGDGWLDIYVVQGGVFPPASDRPPNGDRLYHNRRDGTFEDTTARAGLDGFAGGYGHGVAVGDVDNDGHPDLFITRWRSYALYRNRGDGTFEDVTPRAGLGGDRDWPTSAAFADFDNDGDLDLYVCHYLKWNADHPRRCPDPGGKGARYCDPRHFEARPDHLFRNDGGRFVDVTAEAGLDDREGRGLGVVASDLDEDGRVDLFVANDGTANFLLRNLGGFRFEEVAHASGVAGNASGGYQAGMGVASGDLNGDGLPDLLVTNFYGESTSFFRNLGRGLFHDETAAAGLAAPSRFLLGFGVVLLDANNDGRLDLMTANGHVNDERPRFPYAMPAQLLIGGANGRLTDVSATSGPPWQVLRVGRGLAAGDLDNDGRIDAILVAQNSPLAFFHNKSPGGHFLTIRLEGTASNRDGVGGRVTVTTGERRQRAQRVGGGSFESASDPRIHFGLGDARSADVEVRWPSGRTDRHTGLKVDRGYLLREGKDDAQPLRGFAP